MILPVRVGDTVTFKEADYCFGSGDMTLRITELPSDHLPSGSDWIQVTGAQIAWNGGEIGERTALVRTTALSRPS